MSFDNQDRSGRALPAYSYSEVDENAYSTRWYEDSLLLITLGSVPLLDQITKLLIRLNLNLYELWPSQGAFRLTHAENSGATLSLFPNFLPGIVFFSAIAVGLYFYVFHIQTAPRRLDRLATGLAVGGALGNLIDRVFNGTVVDFISVGLFPIFNLADLAIIVGIGIMVVSMMTGSVPKTSLPQPRSDETISMLLMIRC